MAETTTVYLVRHGETDANLHNMIQGQTDVPLNSSGLKQAELVGKRLRNFPFDVIYSSDLSRAAITAQSIAGEREVIYTQELREWNLGNWQGKYISDIAVIYPEEYRQFKERLSNCHPSGGESIIDLRLRAKNFLTRIANDHAGKNILCVTHGGLLRAFLANVMEMDNYANARTDNTAIFCFRTSDGGSSWQLVFWNDTCHLDGNFVYTNVW